MAPGFVQCVFSGFIGYRIQDKHGWVLDRQRTGSLRFSVFVDSES
jgi:hypothetical protein